MSPVDEPIHLLCSKCLSPTLHRFTGDSIRLRTESPEVQKRDFLAVVDAIEDGRLVLDP